MAQGLFREFLKKKGIDGIEVSSGGISAFAGDEATAGAVRAAKRLGADISDHRSRAVNTLMLDESDLIVCMTKGHYDALQQYVGEDRLYILSQGVPDPFGGDDECYKSCAEKIIGGFEKLLEQIGRSGICSK